MNIDPHYMPDSEIEKNVYPTPLKVFGEALGKIMQIVYIASGCVIGLLIVAGLICHYFPSLNS